MIQTICLWTELSATYIENAVILATVTTISGKKLNQQNHLIALLLFSLCTSIIVAVMNSISVFSYLTPLLSMSFVILISAKFMSSGSLLIRCISSFLAYTVIQSIDYIVLALMALLSSKPEDFFNTFVATPSIYRIWFLAVDKALDVGLYLLLRKKLTGLSLLTQRLLYPLLALTIISYIAMQFLFHIIMMPDFPTMQFAVILSWTFVLGFIVAMIAFFISLTKIEHDRQTQEMLRTENVLMAENYKQLHNNQQSNAKNLHDFKHHLMVIKELVLENKQTRIPSYVDSLLETSYQHVSLCHSGNDITDAIINCKCSEAKTLAISFHFSANLHIPVNIDPVDLCGVLANQIDNAFDACKKITIPEKRIVNVDVRQIHDFLFFRVENTVDHDPFENNPSLKSTKTDNSTPHGLGLKNIFSIAKKYNGTVLNEFRNGYFVSVVSLCPKPFDT